MIILEIYLDFLFYVYYSICLSYYQTSQINLECQRVERELRDHISSKMIRDLCFFYHFAGFSKYNFCLCLVFPETLPIFFSRTRVRPIFPTNFRQTVFVFLSF